jgi:hypothetical protein
MLRTLALVATLVGLLPGCASVRLVDTDVTSYASTPAIPSGAYYRFERLPSQQANPQSQDWLENLAQQALSQAGLKRQDGLALYSVQVGYSVRVTPYGPGEEPSSGIQLGWGLGWGGRSGSIGIGGRAPFFGMPPQQPYYWHRVSLIIRSLSTHQVVYETQATHDGRWRDSDGVVPAMLEAALRGFPLPPAGPRRINIEIPR